MNVNGCVQRTELEHAYQRGWRAAAELQWKARGRGRGANKEQIRDVHPTSSMQGGLETLLSRRSAGRREQEDGQNGDYGSCPG